MAAAAKGPAPSGPTGLIGYITGTSGIGEIILRGLEILGGTAIMGLGFLLLIFTLAPGTAKLAEGIMVSLAKFAPLLAA